MKSNPALSQKYDIALTLRKTVAEVEQMTVAEFNGWVAYLTLLKDKK